MSSTINILFNNILKLDYLPELSSQVIYDYFGIQNEENMYIIYGIYKTLIIVKGISKQLIEKCYLTNRLDELIHKKHNHHKTNYYKYFVKNKIIIGKTNLNEPTNEPIFDIFDDDMCPSCNTNGYITQQNQINPCDNTPDCYICGINICKMCANYDKKEQAYICYKCENPNLITSIKNKINGYKKQDKLKFNIEGNLSLDDVKSLLNKQKFKCYVCDDMVLTYGWKPNCLYQFTLDRINNSLPHNRNNVLICCYYCNCIDMLLCISENKNIKNKVCSSKCHCIKRNIESHRNNISKEKINYLLLK